MKARIKKTGEIVNVSEYAKITLEQCDSWGNPVELSPDEVELIDESEQRIETPFFEALQHNFEKDADSKSWLRQSRRLLNATSQTIALRRMLATLPMQYLQSGKAGN